MFIFIGYIAHNGLPQFALKLSSIEDDGLGIKWDLLGSIMKHIKLSLKWLKVNVESGFRYILSLYTKRFIYNSIAVVVRLIQSNEI